MGFTVFHFDVQKASSVESVKSYNVIRLLMWGLLDRCCLFGM